MIVESDDSSANLAELHHVTLRHDVNQVVCEEGA